MLLTTWQTSWNIWWVCGATGLTSGSKRPVQPSSKQAESFCKQYHLALRALFQSTTICNLSRAILHKFCIKTLDCNAQSQWNRPVQILNYFCIQMRIIVYSIQNLKRVRNQCFSFESNWIYSNSFKFWLQIHQREPPLMSGTLCAIPGKNEYARHCPTYTSA